MRHGGVFARTLCPAGKRCSSVSVLLTPLLTPNEANASG